MPDVLLWPLGVYVLGVLVIVAGMLGLSYIFGQRHRDRTTGDIYESGILPTGSIPARFNVKFYLTAVFFVIFDVEAMFIFVWALTVREAGWTGYIVIMIFIGVLMATLIYLWRVGALEWHSGAATRRQPPDADQLKR
jgi:NADH-quinone oxidoreductase subunit A